MGDTAECAHMKWLVKSFAAHADQRSALASEVGAVRDATAMGATALLELRNAVQAQLQSMSQQMFDLQEDLEATKLELAEVMVPLAQEVGSSLSRHWQDSLPFLR